MSQFTRGWSPLPSGTGSSPFQPPGSSGRKVQCGNFTLTVTDGFQSGAGYPKTFYVLCAGLGPAVDPQVLIVDGDLFPGSSPGWSVSGPYNHYPTDAEICAACVGGTGSSGPPPSQPPTGPAPPPPQPIEITYWNVCYFADNAPAVKTVRAYDSSSAMQVVPGSDHAAGPYRTAADAAANLANDRAGCFPAFNPPPPPPPPQQQVTCNLPDNLYIAVPLPGSEEWCKHQKEIFDTIKAVGIAFLNIAESGLEAIDAWLLRLTNTNLPDSCGVSNLLSCIVSYAKSYGAYLPERIVCGLRWLLRTVKNGFVRTDTCDPTTYASLMAVKYFWEWAKTINAGSDVYVVAHIEFKSIIPLFDRVIDYLLEYACPTQVPWVHEAIECHLSGTLSDEQYECWMRMHGASPEVWRPVHDARRERLTDREIVRWSRQFEGGDDTADEELKAKGWIHDDERAAFLQLYDQLPSIGDHLEFLRKNVFDDKYVEHFRLLEGFEDRFWDKFGGQLRALGMTKETASLHYAAHWINPSFTQQFEMVQRLRPGRVDPSLEFTRNDLLRTMAEMDVGVYFRERLERVSHPVPNLTLVLQMYQFGTVDDVEFVEKLKDLGYDDSNAKQILGSQIIKVRRLNASSGHGWTPAAMAPAYAVGKLTPEQVYAEMTYLGYSRDDGDRLMRRAETELSTSPIRRIQQGSIRKALTTQESAYKCGAITAEQLLSVYANAGIPRNVAEIATANVDSAIAVGLCGQQVQTFRSALLKGKATVDQVREMMLNSGIPPLRVQQYLASWVIEAQLKGPSATAAQILRWVGTGLLDRETATLRLLNLGWSDPDLTLLLAESSAKLARLQQALQRQAAKSQQSAAKAALSLARQAEQTARQLRSRLRGIASIATLQKWVKDGLMDEATFLDYAQARGYDLPDAERYLADALLKASAAKKPPKPKTVPGVKVNGTETQGPTAQP